MSEPQLSVRSAKARDLAHELAQRTGLPVNRLIERALERYDLELRQQQGTAPIDVLTNLMEEGRKTAIPGATSDHSDFYDEFGLPK